MDAESPKAPLPERAVPLPPGLLLAPVHGAPPAVDADPCPGFEAEIRADAAGELAPERIDALRAHLKACPGCMAHRREAVATLAQIGRGLRQRRAAESPTPVRQRGFLGRRRSLLLFVAASAGLYFAVGSGAMGGADPRLWLESGAALVAGEPWGEGDGRRLLLRGDVVAFAGEPASLRSGRMEVSLRSGSLLVESALGPRLRLVEGEASAAGRGRWITPDGVLDLEAGWVLLVVTSEGTELYCRGARGVWTSSIGQESLPADGASSARWDRVLEPLGAEGAADPSGSPWARESAPSAQGPW